MKVAVTGASGHVGNAICKQLINDGITIKALLHTDEDDLIKPEIEVVKGNILDKNSLLTLCKDVDVVFHLAAKISIDPKERKEVFDVNVNGTRNIVEACKEQKVERFIHFSSIHTYDHHPLDEMLDETRPFLENTSMAYEQSKIAGEKIVRQAVENGLDAVYIAPTAIVGPYDYRPSLLGQALIKIYNNKIPMLVEGGYDWVDVRDVANGAISAAKNGKSGEKYILSGSWYSLVDLSKKISEVTDRKTPTFKAPSILTKVGLPFIQAYAALMNEHPLYTSESLDILKNSNRFISNAKAKKELGYNTRDIKETIKDTFEWYKKEGMVD
jgi:dihydroflavonol-4-reductase